jgi:hypothetical protein
LAKYRRKPTVVEAVRFTGHNDAEVMAFCSVARDPIDRKPNLIISTLEGDMLVNVGDYIVKGVAGEFYPVKEMIFYETYEVVK